MNNREEKRARLIVLLKELFQLDKPDLDFGFYRIMHANSEQVSKFLEEDLLCIIGTAFGELDKTRVDQSMADYKVAVKQAKDFGADDPETTEPVKRARAALEAAKASGSNEGEIYDDLCSFFERYYDNGDFMSLRYYARLTDGASAPYAVPYDGREVYFHWANKDQYYIKTSEHLTNFTFDPTQATEFKSHHGELFTDKPLKVRCRIVSANEGEHGNVKTNENKERYFIIHEDEPVTLETGKQGELDLVIQFQYKIDSEKSGGDEAWRRKRLNEAVIAIKKGIVKLSDAGDFAKALLTPAPTIENEDRTLLEKYLSKYTARNTMDYFIHKDLGGFLRRELDFYIKNEVMRLDDMENIDVTHAENFFMKIKIFRKVARHLIEFLAQLEDFQKRLWLKKKFAYDTRYLISVSEIPKEYHSTIKKNAAQIKEWSEILNLESNVDFDQFPNLLIDTVHFENDFVEMIVSEIDSLEDKVEGTLLCSENFSAIRFVSRKYSDEIDAIYIDPPYNTNASAILYKNDYKNSSWCSLMADRVESSVRLLKESGVLCAAIDDEQVSEFKSILSSTMAQNLGTAIVRSNPQSRKSKTSLSPSHEYALFFGKSSESTPGSLGITERRRRRYPFSDEIGHYAWLNFIRTGANDKRIDRPRMYFPIVVHNDDLRIPKMKWVDSRNGVGHWSIVEDLKSGEVAVYPVSEKDGKVHEKCWHRGHEKVIASPEEYRVGRDRAGKVSINFKTRMDENATPTTWWDENEYASSNYGALELKNLFGEKIFDFPKAVALVEDCLRTSVTRNDALIFDYFAGSGTTAHATINLNREDDGCRKFILAEMGVHFEDVIIPRIKKVAYSSRWTDGKPSVDMVTGAERFPRIIKCVYLENYEDTLFNLKQSDLQTGLTPSTEFHREFMLRYWMNVSSRGSQSLLNVEGFFNPTAYTLQIKKSGMDHYVSKNVDLIETFNWLIGVYVEHLDCWRAFSASFKREIDSKLPDDKNARLILDGGLKETKNGKWKLRKIEGYVNPLPGDRSERYRVLVIWRQLTNDLEQDNLILDEWFKKYRLSARDSEFDVVYVNGSNNLPNLRQAEETWKVRLIEEAFHKAMWDTED